MPIRFLVLSGVMLASCAHGSAEVSASQTLSWMLGCWQSEHGMQEEWLIADYPSVIWGEGRRLGADGPQIIEKMTISPVATEFLLLAEPVGQSAQVFFEAERDETSIRFENPDHDYPQRIQYTRDADQLTATISLADGSRPASWTFSPCPAEN